MKNIWKQKHTQVVLYKVTDNVSYWHTLLQLSDQNQQVAWLFDYTIRLESYLNLKIWQFSESYGFFFACAVSSCRLWWTYIFIM